jgi:hypothetical protein
MRIHPILDSADTPSHDLLWEVRDALRYLAEDPPLLLGKSRYARSLLADEPDALERGRLLQRCLRAAIGSLRPPAAITAVDKRWWPYRICSAEYVEGQLRADVQACLAISAPTYVRAKRQGIERIAALTPHLLASHLAARVAESASSMTQHALKPSDIIAATLCGCVIDAVVPSDAEHLLLVLDEPRQGALTLICTGVSLLEPADIAERLTRMVPWARTVQWADWPAPDTLQLCLPHGQLITLRLRAAEIVIAAERSHAR